MDDRLRETLSAMMDDEADELSVRRLLSHDNQSHVRDQWQRWQGIHDLMHRGHSPAEGVDVSAAVRERLDGRTTQLRTSGVAVDREVSQPWRWSAVAMITTALLIGFGAGAGWESTEPLAIEPSAEALASASATESAGSVYSGDAAPVQEVALQGLDKQQWEYMNRYLLEHAQHNSVGAGQGSVGYARLVSASGDH